MQQKRVSRVTARFERCRQLLPASAAPFWERPAERLRPASHAEEQGCVTPPLRCAVAAVLVPLQFAGG